MKTSILYSSTTLCAAAILTACMQTQTLTPATEKDIGINGGTAISPDGNVVLTFAIGALQQTTTVRIEEDHALAGWGRLTPIYRIEGKGALLRLPVRMSIKFDRTVDPARERVFISDFSNTVPLLITPLEVDSETNTVVADVYAFSTFAVVRRSEECADLGCGDSCGEGAGCDREGACVALADIGNCTLTDPDGGTIVVATTDGSFGNQGECKADGGFPFNGGFVTPCGIFESEPNDTVPSAQPAVLGVDQAVDITGLFDGNDDFYLVRILPGTYGSLLVATFSEIDNYSTCDSGLNLALTLTDEFGRDMLTSNTGRCSGINYYDTDNAAGLWPGDFTIRVHGPQPPAGSMTYHMAIYLLGPASAHDGADGGIHPKDSGF